MNKEAISITGLTKVYNKSGETPALDGLNLNIPEGSIFGLLGPNGAGKSTLINILAGTVIKTSGLVKIMDYCLDTHPKLIRSLIGIVPQEVIIDSFFPLKQSLEFTSGYYGIRPQNYKIDEILKALSLYDKRDFLPRQLSGGMKRRYLIAKAMVHYPKILILDEPTAGVDIELRDQLWSYIKKLHNDGVTIIITTHYLEEAEKLCDQIAFINDGKIIKQDSKENLLQSFEEKNIHIEFASPIDIKLLSFPGLVFEQISETKIFCRFNSNKHNFNELLKQIQNCGNIIKDIQMNQADLEYIFKKIIYN